MTDSDPYMSSLLLSRYKTHTIPIVSTTQPTQDTYYPYRLYYSADTRHILSLSYLLLSRHKTLTIPIVSTTQPTQYTYYPYRRYYSANTRHILSLSSLLLSRHKTHYPYRLYYSANTRHILSISSLLLSQHKTHYPYRLYYSADTRHILSLSSLLLSRHKTHTIPIVSTTQLTQDTYYPYLIFTILVSPVMLTNRKKQNSLRLVFKEYTNIPVLILQVMINKLYVPILS